MKSTAIKVGDRFKACPEWDDIGIGVVSKIWEWTGEGLFDITFDNGNDKRLGFSKSDIGKIVNHITPLDELL